jgi:hypothetical protein
MDRRKIVEELFSNREYREPIRSSPEQLLLGTTSQRNGIGILGNVSSNGARP